MSDADKLGLRPANDNPWYCLATLHGEQPIDRLDQELAEKNQLAWQQWLNISSNEGLRQSFASELFNRRTKGRTSLMLPEAHAIADFSHTRFDHRVAFTGFWFSMPADFSSATFSGEANFVGTVFNSKTDFTSTTFSGETNFSQAKFDAGVDFESAAFSERVDFESASVVNPNFRSATFARFANLRQARFSGDRADFFAVMFSGAADFARTMFSTGADFGSATFSERANFNTAKFNIANFNATTFSNRIQFINAEFTGSTIFGYARFALAPDFRGATMHEATEWHGVTWPKPPRNKEDAQRQVYAYERLKQEMEQLKKHEDEQRFFRKELRARRGLESRLTGAWLLNFFYEVFSDYGQSIGRPFFWIIVCFAIGFFFFAGTHVFNGTHLSRAGAAALSFANIFSFLPIKREIMTSDMIAGLSTWAQILSSAQSVFGAVLLFLLGLALRNRFRMK